MKRKILISIIILTISVTTGWFYYQHIYVPKSILQETLVIFENEVRKENYEKLKEIVTEDSAIYKYLPDPKFSEIMGRFHSGVKVVSAMYTVGSDNKVIFGVAKMKAKVDGKYRVFDNLFIRYEKGIWKIRQFGFPDFINY